MDSGNMGDPDLTGHTDHGTTDHTGQTDQAITQVASEESSKPKNAVQSKLEVADAANKGEEYDQLPRSCRASRKITRSWGYDRIN